MTGRKGRKGRKGPGRRPSPVAGLVGLLVLLVAGAGIWYGAQFADAEGRLVARSMDAEAEAETQRRSRLPIPAAGNRIRVEVLNGGGVRGVAASARDELRDAGFDVVHYGNASTFGHEESTVLLRAGDADAARAVARALGIANIEVEHEPSLLVEVTVILGSGWQDRAARSAAPDRHP
ncbi:MAG: LytR family transcriptional regulator [Gemmatimonadales bacterium]|nr:MAG: LytR family transcriptional regulator [Gemmatimonadales bacterium]